MRNVLLAALLIGAGVLAGIASAGGDDPPAQPREGLEPDFGSKCLLVTIAPRTGQAQVERHAIEKARVRRLGDQHFLVGTRILLEDQLHYRGTITWTRLMDVQNIVEFKDASHLRGAYQDELKRAR